MKSNEEIVKKFEEEIFASGMRPKSWKGYTLSELEFAREVNSVRQAVALDNLKASLEAYRREKESLVFGRFDSLFSVMNYASTAVKAYNQIRKIFSMFRK